MVDSTRARSWKRRTQPRIDLTNAEPVLYSTPKSLSYEQFNMAQVMAWIILFVALMLILEHGVIAWVEEKLFAWRPVHAL